MPRLEPPPELGARLHVAASQRCVELVRQASLRSELRYWLDIARVWSDNLMRPFALPVAGGLVSAVFLFMMVVPMYGVRASSPDDDVPTSLTTVATLRGSTYSFGVEHSDVVVDVLIDEQGRMISYSAPAGQDWQVNPKIRRSVENALLCTQFNPATLFGLPKSGKLRITFRRDEVEVKG